MPSSSDQEANAWPNDNAWPEPASGAWDPEAKCWLVWEQHPDGRMYLRAICTQPERATRCVTQLKYDARKRDIVGDPVIEESRINHFFGSQFGSLP